LEETGKGFLVMSDQVEISICIPAYKRVEYLTRLLDSIAEQDFNSFEVILTDDSPGAEVSELLEDYSDEFPFVYQKNQHPMGMPQNWNEAIRLARGKWIKLMHDDDWFARPDALERLSILAEKEPDAMIFCGYSDVLLKSGKKKKRWLNSFRFRQAKKEPVSLLSRNIIGPPSVVMYKNDGRHFYDERLRWLVDIDMYVRRIADNKIVYLPEFLINVGVGDEQVTTSVHGNPEVEVPEHFYFLEKTGLKRLRNILVYDYWWRLFRNFRIFGIEDIHRFGYAGSIHPVLLSMIDWQKKIPRNLLVKGIFSKCFMFVHFLLHRNRLPV
jgi:glycosyltransferase involved in cell wall biosynthesis